MTADAAPAAGPPSDADPAGITVVHLVRHGEVDNPRGVIYGRLPGYHLSADGQLMAKAAADFLADRDVTVLRCSPLDRAVETAAPIGQQFGLEAEIDERLIEPWNHFEGMTFGVGDGSLRKPRHWMAPAQPVPALLGRALQGGRGADAGRGRRRGPGRARARGGLREPPAADLGRPAGGRAARGCGTTRAGGSARWAA